MKILIAEDDFVSRKFMFKLFSQYGECDMTIDGIETVEAFVLAYNLGKPYDLICLDIMMPKIDGLKALKAIKSFEEKKNVPQFDRCKVIITSALDEEEVTFNFFRTGNEVYLTKPIDANKIKDVLKKLGLIS